MKRRFWAYLPIHTLLPLPCLEFPLLVLEEVIQHRPVFFEIVEWDWETARTAYLMDVDYYNWAGSRDTIYGVLWDESCKVWGAVLEYSSYKFKHQLNLNLHFLKMLRSIPLPQNRTILGGPSKALNWIVILPFPLSQRWLIVSFPLPVRSMYQNVFSSGTPKYGPPFGETLTCPSPDKGAVATQNIFWSRHQFWREVGMVS